MNSKVMAILTVIFAIMIVSVSGCADNNDTTTTITTNTNGYQDDEWVNSVETYSAEMVELQRQITKYDIAANYMQCVPYVLYLDRSTNEAQEKNNEFVVSPELEYAKEEYSLMLEDIETEYVCLVDAVNTAHELKHTSYYSGNWLDLHDKVEFHVKEAASNISSAQNHSKIVVNEINANYHTTTGYQDEEWLIFMGMYMVEWQTISTNLYSAIWDNDYDEVVKYANQLKELSTETLAKNREYRLSPQLIGKKGEVSIMLMFEESGANSYAEYAAAKQNGDEDLAEEHWLDANPAMRRADAYRDNLGIEVEYS